jgi:hypothetical protein
MNTISSVKSIDSDSSDAHIPDDLIESDEESTISRKLESADNSAFKPSSKSQNNTRR